MFDPVYQLLRREGGLRLAVSSGQYRRKPLLGWFPPKDPAARNEILFAEFDIEPSHLIASSWGDPRSYDVFVAASPNVRIRPRRARTKVQIFHGVSFRNFSVRSAYLAFDHLFFPGRYMMEQYLARGLLKEGDPRIEIVGMPKLDRLVDGSLDRSEILQELELDPSLPTVLWCPTGARHNSYDLLGAAGLAAIQKTGANLLLKFHDHPHLPRGTTREGLLESARAALGPRARLVDRSDVAPLMVAADLLLSDASSVAFEFCVLDRPILFVDVPDLLRKRARLPENAMDLESHGRKVGRVVDSAEDLARAIGEELAEPSKRSAERRAAAEHIFHLPGGASRRAADRIAQLAREAAE
jgi:hypothetical protein